MFKVVERPQHMLMRVAVGIHMNVRAPPCLPLPASPSPLPASPPPPPV